MGGLASGLQRRPGMDHEARRRQRDEVTTRMAALTTGDDDDPEVPLIRIVARQLPRLDEAARAPAPVSEPDPTP